MSNSISRSTDASVAICIPTYNQAPYLASAARDAFAQIYRAANGEPVEVWLSDDASSDATPDVVRELQAEFPALRATRQERNLGMSGNPRWVVSQPKTEFIVKLDSDDRLRPDYVSRLVELLQAHPRAGYGHCAVRQIDERDNVTRVRRLHRATGFVNAEDALRASVLGYRVAANICIFRREALEEVNFYREDMSFCDDWDISVRLADAGWGNVYCDDILADYRVWEDADQVRPRRKLAEIGGCIRVFDDALAPAFARRDWNKETLTKQRQELALRHVSALDSPKFSADEKRELLRLLGQLGDSPRLRRRVQLLKFGGGPLLRLQHTLGLLARDKAKSVLGVAKRRSVSAQPRS